MLRHCARLTVILVGLLILAGCMGGNSGVGGSGGVDKDAIKTQTHNTLNAIMQAASENNQSEAAFYATSDIENDVKVEIGGHHLAWGDSEMKVLDFNLISATNTQAKAEAAVNTNVKSNPFYSRTETITYTFVKVNGSWKLSGWEGDDLFP